MQHAASGLAGLKINDDGHWQAPVTLIGERHVKQY